MEENRAFVTPLKNLLASSGIRVDRSRGLNSPFRSPMLANQTPDSTPSPKNKKPATPTIRVGLSRHIKSRNWNPFCSDSKNNVSKSTEVSPATISATRSVREEKKLEPAKLFSENKITDETKTSSKSERDNKLESLEDKDEEKLSKTKLNEKKKKKLEPSKLFSEEAKDKVELNDVEANDSITETKKSQLFIEEAGGKVVLSDDEKKHIVNDKKNLAQALDLNSKSLNSNIKLKNIEAKSKKDSSRKQSKRRKLRNQKTSTPENTSDDDFEVDEGEIKGLEIINEEESAAITENVRGKRKRKSNAFYIEDSDDDLIIKAVIDKSVNDKRMKNVKGKKPKNEEENVVGKSKNLRRKRIISDDDDNGGKEEEELVVGQSKNVRRKRIIIDDDDEGREEVVDKCITIDENEGREEVVDKCENVRSKRVIIDSDNEEVVSLHSLKEQIVINDMKQSDENMPDSVDRIQDKNMKDSDSNLNMSKSKTISVDKIIDKNTKEQCIIQISDTDEEAEVSLLSLKQQIVTKDIKQNFDKPTESETIKHDLVNINVDKNIEAVKKRKHDKNTKVLKKIIIAEKNDSPKKNESLDKDGESINNENEQNTNFTDKIVNHTDDENTKNVECEPPVQHSDDDFDISVKIKKQTSGTTRIKRQKSDKISKKRTKASDAKVENVDCEKRSILQRIDFNKDYSSPTHSVNDDDDFVDAPGFKIFEKKKSGIRRVHSSTDGSVSSQEVKADGGERKRRAGRIESSSDEEDNQEKKNLLQKYNSSNSLSSNASESKKTKTFNHRTLSLKKTFSSTSLTDDEDTSILNHFTNNECKVELTQLPIHDKIKELTGVNPENENISLMEKTTLSALNVEEKGFTYNSEDDLKDFQTPVKKERRVSKMKKKGVRNLGGDMTKVDKESAVKTPTREDKSTHLSDVIEHMELETKEVPSLNNLREEVYNLEIAVYEKRRKLEELQRVVHYKDIHDVEDLSRRTGIWKNGCKQALEQLLIKLKENIPTMDLKMLLARLQITPEFVDYDEENDNFK